MRPTLLVLMLAATATATAAGPLAAQDFPTRPPAPMPIKAAQFPPFQEATLPNGVRLIVVENHKLPVISVELAFAAGRTYDAAGKSGTADMVATLLTKGAGKRTADEFSAAIEGIGGSISAGADADFLTVSANFLTADAPFALGLMADAVVRPTFADKEVELARTQMLSSLQLEQSQPASIAARFFAKGLYGENPYGRRADVASAKAITHADLTAFQAARLRPAGALLVFAGDISLARARELAATAFAGWTGAAPAPLAVAGTPTRTSTEILLVHRAGSVQSNILAGNLTWTPSDPRVYGARIANQVLGGGGDSRLFLILREQKGWTYGAYSGFTRNKGTGYFQASAEVRTEVTDSSVAEILAQVKRIRDEPISAKEFEDAKSSLVGRFPLQVETAAQVAAQVTTARLLGLPNDYVQTYRQKLAAVTPADARTAARAGISRDAAFVVVVGDGAKIYDKLKAIAPVKIVNVDGAPMTPADFVVKAGALDLNLSALTAHTDSFSVLVQGKEFGSQVAKLEKVAGGWKYTETSAIPMAGVQQSTTLTFSDAIEMQELHQTGTAGGQATKIDIVYAGGRAKGKATTPSQAGPKTIDVDVEMPKGAIDDNGLQVLMAAMKWSATAKIPVTALQSGKGTLLPAVLTVAGEEKVKVAAGEFDAWKVELSGGEAPLTFWVQKGPVGRVLKIVPTGQPISIELVK
ncbi:MAG: insulinase family protein [Gemmatimonadaceae bacterium]